MCGSIFSTCYKVFPDLGKHYRNKQNIKKNNETDMGLNVPLLGENAEKPDEREESAAKPVTGIGGKKK